MKKTMDIMIILSVFFLLFSVVACSRQEAQENERDSTVEQGLQESASEEQALETGSAEDTEEGAETEELLELETEEPEIEGTDYCEGSPEDDSMVCIDDNLDGQITREAIEEIGEIKDARKDLFFDQNSFYLEYEGVEYKITLEEKVGSFDMKAIPKDKEALCGLSVEFRDGKYSVSFNPGRSSKDFSDAEYCLLDCGVEEVSPNPPTQEEQACLLECSVEVCTS